MEKIVLLLGLYLFTMTSSRAQIKDIEFMVGPNLGTLRSNLPNSVFLRELDYNATMGYSTGVGSRYYFTENFSLGAQLLYQWTTMRGNFLFEYESNANNYTGIIDLTTSFDHISLPVRARYTVGNKVKFSGELGGFINCLLHSTVMGYRNDYPMADTFAEATQQYTRLDAGLSVGLSSHVSLNEKLLLKLSLTDNHGLVNISALQYEYIPIRSSNYVKTNTANLLVGIVYSVR